MADVAPSDAIADAELRRRNNPSGGGNSTSSSGGRRPLWNTLRINVVGIETFERAQDPHGGAIQNCERLSAILEDRYKMDSR